MVQYPSIELIAAVSANGVLSSQGHVPWHMPDDLSYFKKMTQNKTMIMGRKTWETLKSPLPSRQHIVLSRNPSSFASSHQVQFVSCQARAMDIATHPIIIIGGSEIYRLWLDRVTKAYMTYIHVFIEGDTFFPVMGLLENFVLIEHRHHAQDNRHAYACDFLVFERAIKKGSRLF